MTGDQDDETLPPWHERTSTVVGYSIAALIALGLLYFAVSCVAREFNGPDEVPQYFLDPGASTTSHGFATTTTTSTITSTSPPQTTDISPSETTTTTTFKPNATTRSRTTTSDQDTDTSTRRPRFNETRPNLPPLSP